MLSVVTLIISLLSILIFQIVLTCLKLNVGVYTCRGLKRNLMGGKVNMLSIGGRYTLIRSILGSLGICYMSLFKMFIKFSKNL